MLLGLLSKTSPERRTPDKLTSPDISQVWRESVLVQWELDYGNEQVWLVYRVSKELSISPQLAAAPGKLKKQRLNTLITNLVELTEPENL
jgi:hypothetical protein